MSSSNIFHEQLCRTINCDLRGALTAPERAKLNTLVEQSIDKAIENDRSFYRRSSYDWIVPVAMLVALVVAIINVIISVG